jgi:glyceraldehyde 3-phosphate dehydrogenase
MAVKVGINGFGRIGRLSLRTILKYYPNDIEVVAINDISDVKTNAHLFKWDSTYGPFEGDVSVEGEECMVVNGKKIAAFKGTSPDVIPWDTVGAEIVLESTGRFNDATKAVGHREKGVKKVLISAPAKNEDVTVVLGVNEGMYDPKKHHVVSNASCTTNGLAPVAKALNDRFGIERGLLTTIHAYTNSQKLQDTYAKDLRDARAACENIIPSSTGAAKAVGLVIPELKGKFSGMAFRIPTNTVSAVDFTAVLAKEATPAEINAVVKEYAEGPMKGILEYTELPLVSTDMKGNFHSSIFSAIDTIAIGNLIKVVAWYDNEWGYACRIADMLKIMADKGL